MLFLYKRKGGGEREKEVRQSPGEEQVACLNVSVYLPLSVQVREGEEQLAHHVGDAVLGERPGLLDDLGQRARLQVLHHNP